MAIKIELADRRPLWMKIADHSGLLLFINFFLGVFLIIIFMKILDYLSFIQLIVESPEGVYFTYAMALVLTLAGAIYILIQILMAKQIPKNNIEGFFDGRNVDIEVRSERPVSVGSVTETVVADSLPALQFEPEETIIPQEGVARIRKTLSDVAMGILIENKLFIFIKNVPDRVFYHRGKQIPLPLITLISGKPTEKERKAAIIALMFAMAPLFFVLLTALHFLLFLLS